MFTLLILVFFLVVAFLAAVADADETAGVCGVIFLILLCGAIVLTGHFYTERSDLTEEYAAAIRDYETPNADQQDHWNFVTCQDINRLLKEIYKSATNPWLVRVPFVSLHDYDPSAVPEDCVSEPS